jgi:hypothetical protein
MEEELIRNLARHASALNQTFLRSGLAITFCYLYSTHCSVAITSHGNALAVAPGMEVSR